MNRLLSLLLLCLLFAATAESAATDASEVPFEPPEQDFFRPTDKFARPPAVVPPQFIFPFELRRGAGAVTPAEVTILIQLDGRGRAKTLKVLRSRHPHFTRSALDALKKAQWDSTNEVWFYYRYVYTLDEK